MEKQESTASVVLRPRAAGTPLYCWLYEEIRAAILESRLPPGLKLPSRAVLARQYRVSVTTVVAASEQLVEHGYLDVREGRGTYVRAPRPAPAPTPARAPRRELSTRGRLLAAHSVPKLSSSHAGAAFRLDQAALEIFPLETWNRLAADRTRRGRNPEWVTHGEPLGFRPLRAALADYVSRARGVRCEADQVVVTSGTQHSLDLVARLLLDPGDEVWMEDPGYAPASSLLRSHGAKVIGVPVDAEGIDCDAGRVRSPLARLAYVTAACQFPFGMPLSRERRLKLIQWANEAGAWIFEDDYDGQLQCSGRCAPALHGADRHGCVIYSNSCNGMLFPALRLGFLVLPPAFIEPAAAALSVTERYHPVAEQAVLADFITQGHFDRHMQRMRELCAERREALVGAATAELTGLMRFSEPQAGWQAVGWLAAGMNEAEAWRRAVARDIDSVALASLTTERRLPAALVFGLGSADARAIRTALRRLGRVLRVLAWQTRRPADSHENVLGPARPHRFAAAARELSRL